MKKLLLIALAAGILTFAAAPRSDGGVYFTIGAVDLRFAYCFCKSKLSLVSTCPETLAVPVTV